MKKLIVLFLAIGLLAGCGSSDTSSDQNKKDEKHDLMVGGSTSVQPLMEQVAEAFNKKDEGVVTVQGGGSSVGVKGASDGTFNVGMSSRELKDEEKPAVDTYEIALDGIVIIVNKENKLKDITLEQAKDVFTGKITNWKELGGADEEIAVVSREEGSGTRDGFESIVGYESDELVKDATIQNAGGAVISSVVGNKQAIGYVSMGSLSDEVNGVTVDGVKASEDTILDKTYTLQRPFLLVVKKGNTDASALLDFIFSEEGKKLVVEHKYVPVERK